MIRSFGARQMTKGDGDLRPVKFTNLVRLDEETGDGRFLRSEGGGVRDLPRTIYAGFTEDQHDGAVVAGRLDAVEFDPDNNTVTAWGWLNDDENGRTAARLIANRSLRHNSIRMAEIEISIDWGDDDDWFAMPTIVFEKWNVASTTIIGVPAFKDSSVAFDDAEIVASMYVDPGEFYADDSLLEITAAGLIETPAFPQPEIVADGSLKPPWEYFFMPEDPDGQAILVAEPDENGWIQVFGHLALWNTCHDGIDGRCVIAPRPPDDYRSWNASNVLTDRGMVQTGPLFFLHGHPDAPLGDRDAAAAYGGIENAWADVRVIPGQRGPWLAGVVRPGVTNESVYMARASRISGHWAGDGRLKAAVSVNCPGYDVPGSKVYADEDGLVYEVVASYVEPCDTAPRATASWSVPISAAVTSIQYANSGSISFTLPYSITVGAPNTADVPAAGPVASDVDDEAELAAAEAELMMWRDADGV